MIEILFRGKRKDNGEWVEGGYYREDYTDNVYITFWNSFGLGFMDACQVDPDTVGQYTGLTDKNGKRIFEGDVVAQSWYDFDEPADDCFGEVLYWVGDCSFSVLDLNKNEIMAMGQGCSYHWEAEVIGNIHDNPELLEVSHE